MLVCVRCTDTQAAGLARILRAHYPTVRPRLLPLFDKQQYTHCFRVPESESALRRRWPSIQLQLLLAASEQPASTPRQAKHLPASSPGTDGRRGAEAPITGKPPTITPPSGPAVIARSAIAGDAADPSMPVGTNETPIAAAPPVPDPQPAPPDPRLVRLDQLLAEGELAMVLREVPADDPVPAVRGRLGVALARNGSLEEARTHLLAAWHAREADQQVTLELARILWRRGDYDVAAVAYGQILDAPPEALEPRDCAAIAELASSGEFAGLSDERQLRYVEAFFARADLQELHEPHIVPLARRGLALARQIGATNDVFHAYQHLLDALLAHRAGQRLHSLLDDMRDDYWQGRLNARDRFDLMDELTDYVQDYPLLRESLIESCEELLRQAMESARREGAFSEYARDLYRTWRKLARRGELGEEYRRLVVDLRVAGQGVAAGADAEGDAPPRLDGRRIALVGGHARTREHVRARLESWGARVDEVAPPTNGRVKEREIADRIHSSDLILLIVGYMGHDMSTVVNNLVRRDALAGTVLPVDCRGTSGVCRAIADWAARA